MEETLYDVPLYRQFAGLDIGADRLPDESTILRFRHLLEQHGLAARMFDTVGGILAAKGLLLQTGTAVDATIIAAPSSTKNSTGTRDPETHQTKKGNQWRFGMKEHIGVDAASGLVHTMTTTPTNAHDLTQTHELLHSQQAGVVDDLGYRGQQVKQAHPDVLWHVAMMPGKRRKLDKGKEIDVLIDEVEHPFRVIKRQFGHVKVRHRGLQKNTAQLYTLFALANPWMVRKTVLWCEASPRPKLEETGQTRH